MLKTSGQSSFECTLHSSRDDDGTTDSSYWRVGRLERLVFSSSVGYFCRKNERKDTDDYIYFEEDSDGLDDYDYIYEDIAGTPLPADRVYTPRAEDPYDLFSYCYGRLVSTMMISYRMWWIVPFRRSRSARRARKRRKLPRSHPSLLKPLRLYWALPLMLRLIILSITLEPPVQEDSKNKFFYLFLFFYVVWLINKTKKMMKPKTKRKSKSKRKDYTKRENTMGKEDQERFFFSSTPSCRKSYWLWLSTTIHFIEHKDIYTEMIFQCMNRRGYLNIVSSTVIKDIVIRIFSVLLCLVFFLITQVNGIH